MICTFEAPDAESVRQAYRQADIGFSKIWTAQVIEPEGVPPVWKEPILQVLEGSYRNGFTDEEWNEAHRLILRSMRNGVLNGCVPMRRWIKLVWCANWTHPMRKWFEKPTVKLEFPSIAFGVPKFSNLKFVRTIGLGCFGNASRTVSERFRNDRLVRLISS